MRHPLIVPVLVAAVAFMLTDARGGPTGAGEGETEKVLDMLSYWRSYYQLAPASISEKLWEKELKDNPKLKPTKYLSYPFNGHWDTSPILTLIASPPPPAGWFAADFDDGTWTRIRYPMLMGSGEVSELGVASACFRARFFVDDPAKVGKEGSLVLHVAYRGGLAAWVNGQEVGRGHLRPEPITGETKAIEYTEDEYSLPPTEEGAPNRAADESRLGTPTTGQAALRRCIQDISPDYAVTQERMKQNYSFAAPLTAEENAALCKRRDRSLDIEIAPALLRKGVNILAVQVVRADLHPVVVLGERRLGTGSHYGWIGMSGGAYWLHGQIVDLKLTCSNPGAVSPEKRPAGVQVWADSPNRRLFSSDFGDPGLPANNPSRTVRIVAARGGTFSGQAVLGTGHQVPGVSAKMSDLAGPGGAKIPAAAMMVRYGASRPVRDMGGLGVERNPTLALKDPLLCSDTWMALVRYAARDADGQLPYSREGKKNSDRREKDMQQIRFFDELAPEPPATVPADSCQPIWVTVKVPPDSTPGLYAGTLSVSADGAPAGELPVNVQVMDVKLPDPAAVSRGERFSTMVAMEQSPWGVAKAYKVEPWSDEHFARIEQSFKRMAELGNDYLVIPVLLDSEFGNRQDSFVVWTKDADGKFGCDFSRFDRYMDLAQKYMPKPAAVVFGVVHPPENDLWIAPRVLCRVAPGAAGLPSKTAPMPVPMGEANPFRRGGGLPTFSDAEIAAAREFFKPFVDGVLSRMEKRGLKQSLFWGYAWDYTLSIERYQPVFDALAPGVKWARGTHGHGGIVGKQGMSGPFGFVGSIVCLPQPVKRVGSAWEICSHKGWKNPLYHLALPRVQNAVLCVEGRSVPFYWRLFPELALCGGARGICRIGADYWEGTCQDGWRGGGQVGIGIVCTFWPGKGEANASARFEMLREGLQEAEARVILEKALEGPLADDPSAKAVQKMLDHRILATLHIMRSFYTQRAGEQDFGWQERSWDLFAAAARIAEGKTPTEQDKAKFFGLAK